MSEERDEPHHRIASREKGQQGKEPIETGQELTIVTRWKKTPPSQQTSHANHHMDNIMKKVHWKKAE
jgi:hypothetical protein